MASDWLGRWPPSLPPNPHTALEKLTAFPMYLPSSRLYPPSPTGTPTPPAPCRSAAAASPPQSAPDSLHQDLHQHPAKLVAICAVPRPPAPALPHLHPHSTCTLSFSRCCIPATERSRSVARLSILVANLSRKDIPEEGVVLAGGRPDIRGFNRCSSSTCASSWFTQS